MTSRDLDGVINRLVPPLEEGDRPTNVPGFADVETETAQRFGVTGQGLQSARDRLKQQFAFEPIEEGTPPDASFIGKVFNSAPVRAVGNAFDRFEQAVADPIAGAYWGFGSKAFSFWNETYQQRADSFQFNVLDHEGGFWGASGAWNRNRDQSFSGEKFISSLVFDPTSYVGFGLLKKVPAVRKIPFVGVGPSVGKYEISLGALEEGYIQTTNLLFEAGSRLLRKLPKSPGQKLRVHGQKLQAEVKDWLEEIAGGGRFTSVKRADFQAAAAKLTSREPEVLRTLTLKERRVRQSLFSVHSFSRKEADKLVKIAKGAYSAEAHHTASQYWKWVAQGDISADKAANYLVRVLGGNIDDAKSVQKMTSFFKDKVKTLDKEVRLLTDHGSIDSFTKQFINRGVRHRRDEMLNGYEAWVANQGRIAGLLVKGIVGTNHYVIQQGIQKWVARPLARTILMTPGFVVDEMSETLARQLLARSTLGFKSSQLGFITKHTGHDTPVSLLRNEQQATTRAATISDEFDQANIGSNEILQKLSGGRISIPPKILDKLNWLGRKSYDLANDLGLMGRRGTLDSRTTQRIHQAWDRPEFRWASTHVQDVPESLRAVQDELREHLTLRMAAGNIDGVRKLKEELLAGNFRDAELLSRIDQLQGEFITSADKLGLINWIESGADPLRLDDVIDELAENVYKNVYNSADAAIAQTYLGLDAVRQLDLDDPVQAAQALRILDNVFIDAVTMPDRLNSYTAGRIARGARESGGFGRNAWFSPEIKGELWKDNYTKVDKFFEEYDEILDELADMSNRLREGLGDNYTEYYRTVKQRWTAERAEIQRYMAEHSERGSKFWEGYYDIRRSHWDDRSARRDLITLRRQGGLLQNNGELPFKPVPHVIANDHPLTTADVARAVGSTDEKVVDWIISASYGGKESFKELVTQLAGDFKVRIAGDAESRLGDFYDRVVVATLKRRSRELTAFTKMELQFDQFSHDMKALLKSPGFTDQMKGDLDEWIEGAAQLMERNDLTRFTLKSKAAYAAGVEDYKQAFVNYDDVNILDAVINQFFPFGTYETRRLPFLLRQGLQHPKLYDTLGPDGDYWTSTDNGYYKPLDGLAGAVPFLGGFQFNPIGGTFMNTPRRIFQEPFSQHGSTFERLDANVFQRTGFYFGPLQRAAIDAMHYVMGGERPELGEALTPAMQVPLLTMQHIPGLSSWIGRIRSDILPDKFVERQVMTQLWNMGLPAHEFDFEAMKPKDGSSLTWWDVERAFIRASNIALAEVVTGKTRHRGESERKLEKFIEDFYVSKGLSVADQRKFKRLGIPFSTLVTMSPAEQRTLQEFGEAGGLKHYKEKSYANNALHSGERREVLTLVSDFWIEIDDHEQEAVNKIEALNTAWQNGERALSEYRQEVQAIRREQANRVQTLRGRSFNPLTNEWELTSPTAKYARVPLTETELDEFKKKYGSEFEPLRHELEELLQAYREIQPHVDEKGVEQMGEFFEMQRAFRENVVPAELLRAFDEDIERKLTEPERVLKELSYTSLGDYWSTLRRTAIKFDALDVINDVASLEQRGFYEQAALQRQSPQYKVVNRIAEAEKTRMRLSDPKLEYALLIWGFITQPKNPTTAKWWREDQRKPNLGRITG